MYNKQHCGECGISFVLHSFCNVCKEHYSWVCGQCGRLENHDNVNCEQQIAIARI